ncbi:MAG: tRNA (adenosine(37)-N6)-threonylcarbamoyltransferase complex dimerization subunit type 1 TsaB, partial [Candidatus Zixiibacteriota bacterium]
MTSGAENYLALDTSGNRFSACALGGDSLHVCRAERDSGPGDICQLVSQALQKAELDFPNLSGILVSLGPGSFTGLRVGLAYA